jgi:hypothetical protein
LGEWHAQSAHRLADSAVVACTGFRAGDWLTFLVERYFVLVGNHSVVNGRSGTAPSTPIPGWCRAMIGLWGLPRDRKPLAAAMPPPVWEEWSPVSGCSGGSARRRG